MSLCEKTRGAVDGQALIGYVLKIPFNLSSSGYLEKYA